MKTQFKTNKDLRKLCFTILAEEMGITADNLIQEIIQDERARLITEFKVLFNKNNPKGEPYYSIPYRDIRNIMRKNRRKTNKEIQEETLEELEE